MSLVRRTESAQQAFARGLLDPMYATPSGLRAWNGSDPARRFAVYRNNIVVSWIDALADTYPVVRELVGADFFDAMARRYATRHPPADPVLVRYGDGFARFIEDFEPATGLPYLADVARLEWLHVRAYHAADAQALDAADIGRRLFDPQALAGSTLRLDPSVAVLASDHAIVSLWAAHQGAGDLAGVDPNVAECALVLRQHDGVLVIAVAPETAAFVRCLGDGATLATATATAAASACGSGFDLSGSLALLIRHRAIVAWHSPLKSWP
jgi:hypothetical protein